ncbi:MAG TPA: S8 family peptidase [Chitinophagales bacterium]|nr:S8 family peptidase [Chitinophagales bacterium]
MKIKILTFFLFIFIFKESFAQDTLEIGDGKYINESNTWYRISSNGLKYQLHSTVLTIKFNQSYDSSAIESFASQNGLTFFSKNILGYYKFQISSSSDIIEKLLSLSGNEMIETIEPNTFGSYFSIPDDVWYGSQWYLDQISAPAAWDIETGRNNVTVAVLDFGVKWLCEDLGPSTIYGIYQNIYLNPGEDAWLYPEDPSSGNGIDDDNNGFIDDWKGWNFDYNDNNTLDNNGHGTHIAGTIAAKTNNYNDIAGIAGGWNDEGVKIMPVTVLNNYSAIPNVDDAILYAAQNGAKIIQIAWETVETPAINDAITKAYHDYGVLIVCASGNYAQQITTYPANHADVIAVDATDQFDNKAALSDYGSYIKLAAPGLSIEGLNGSCGQTSQNGTSSSSAIVSGVAALILSLNLCLTPDEIKELLFKSADKTGGYNYDWNPSKPGHSVELGYGRVNAYQALQLTLNNYLQNETISSVKDYDAVTSITSGRDVTNLVPIGDFIIEQNSIVNFRAGTEISLEDGFEASGEFSASIFSCPLRSSNGSTNSFDNYPSGDNNNSSKLINIYPNPTDNMFSIAIKSYDRCSIELINYCGKKMISTFFDGPLGKIDISKLSAGFYVVQVSDSKGQIIGYAKLLVQ